MVTSSNEWKILEWDVKTQKNKKKKKLKKKKKKKNKKKKKEIIKCNKKLLRIFLEDFMKKRYYNSFWFSIIDYNYNLWPCQVH